MEMSEAGETEARWGPIVAFFNVLHTPAGAAPDHVRERWVGLNLPVRAYAWDHRQVLHVYVDELSGEVRLNADGVPVVIEDAVTALEQADRIEAAAFWAATMAIGDRLVFQASDGLITPIQDLG